MKTPAGVLLAFAACLAPGAVLTAQAPSLGFEFQANTFTTGNQSSSAVASRGDGSFVVVWYGDYQDGSGFGVLGQRFDAAGLPSGPEFLVNTYTTGYQWFPRVGADAAGNFVVVWEGSGPGGSNNEIFGQRFDASGAKLGAEFLVNTYTTGIQFGADVSVEPSGGFVVVWASKDQVSDYDIFGQRFNSSGAKVGAEFLVNTYTTSRQIGARAATDQSGRFVVAWTSPYGQDGSGAGVFAQRFNASGTKAGPEFQINSFTTYDQKAPDVAMDRAGNFTVVWQSELQDFVQDGVFGQRFDASGAKVGPEFQVNTYFTGQQAGPLASIDPNGNLLVVWSSNTEDGSDFGVFGQRFDRAGARLGTEFQINAYTTGDQGVTAVADTGRGFVVVWGDSGQDGSSFGVFGRRQRFVPKGLSVDVHGNGTSDLNGVLEPGDAARIEPIWTNEGGGVSGLTGQVDAVTGPAGPTYTLLDPQASYTDTLFGAQTDCNDGNSNPCYAVQISGSRPATHWDAVMQEDLSTGGSQVWTLHIGDSFTDVPRSEPFYKKIETLLHKGITTGCTATTYCPGTAVARDQMAIFVAKGIAGLGELVPTTGLVNGQAYNCSPGGHSLFNDVSPTDSSCRHVHYLASQNVTLGCNASQYCPSQTITRDAMASFIAKAVVAPGGGNAIPLTYGPDPDTGRSYSCSAGTPNLHFTDVSVSNAFCKHIHYLWAKGIVDGCTATQYCPASSVNRDAMAKFIANGFGLQLYGP
jgi:hypothetical protein